MRCLERSHLRARLLAVLTAATLSLCSGWAAATPPSLKVSGSASFATETRSSGEGFEVRAVLTDEVGRPSPAVEVRAQLATTHGGALRRCDRARAEPASELALTTDSGGRVCAFVTGAHPATVELTFEDARGYYERTARRVQLPDSATDTFEVGFDPPLGAVSLDQPLQSIGVVARARPGSSLPETAELVLFLVDSRGERELTRVALDGFGEVHRLSLVSTTFGPPGPARVVARLRTRAGEERASTTAAILRTATAVLKVSGLEAGVEPGETVQVGVASALGPVPSGVVEARSGGRSVAAARVKDGSATLALPASPTTLLTGAVAFEYVGDGPGWLSGPPVEVRVRPRGPNYARSALWIIAGALAAAAVVRSWRRPARPRPVAEPPPARSRASVEVLEALGANEGYRGFVRDAHEAVPITPAVVSFVAPGASGRVLAQCRTGADGAFSTDISSFPSGTLIEVSAPFHATLTAPLPAPGVLELSLVSRRRALLDRLVRWAERHGKPWSPQGGEPTPATLAATASVENEPQVESWARAVEQLAFGASPPDAAHEQAAGVTGDPKTSRERGID
jgi:hypothetical protein